MAKIVTNPCYGTNGKIVDIDLDEVVLHTVTGERMTEAFFEQLAIAAEDEQNVAICETELTGIVDPELNPISRTRRTIPRKHGAA